MGAFDLGDEIRAYQRERRRAFNHEKQQKWLMRERIFPKTNAAGQQEWPYDRAPDPDRLPGEYGKDPECIAVQWGTGFAVIAAEAFAKMPKSKLSKLMPKR